MTVLKRYFHNRNLILKYWISGTKNNVSLYELVRMYFTIHTNNWGKTQIREIHKIDGYYKIFFNNFPDPLFFPDVYPLQWLYHIVYEVLNEKNWHYYTINETNVNSDDIILDCGAAEGLFSLVHQNRCKKIYAIEPVKRFVDALHLTFHKTRNVEILPYAVSDSPGINYLMENHFGSYINSSGPGIPINVTTLDSLFYSNNIEITFIKADLEGYDLKALLGAESLIKKNCPKIAITTYHDQNHFKKISHFLQSINPQYNIRAKGIRPSHGHPVMLHAWVD